MYLTSILTLYLYSTNIFITFFGYIKEKISLLIIIRKISGFPLSLDSFLCNNFYVFFLLPVSIGIVCIYGFMISLFIRLTFFPIRIINFRMLVYCNGKTLLFLYFIIILKINWIFEKVKIIGYFMIPYIIECWCIWTEICWL